MADAILRHLDAIPEEQQRRLRAVFERGMRVSELARLSGLDAKRLRVQMHRLVARLLSERFRFILSHARDLSPTRRRIAIHCFIHGRSLRSAAQELHLSMHAVRRHHVAILALCEKAGV